MRILLDAIDSSCISLNVLERLIWAVRHGGDNHLYRSVTHLFFLQEKPMRLGYGWLTMCSSERSSIKEVVDRNQKSSFYPMKDKIDRSWHFTREIFHVQQWQSSSGNWVVAESWLVRLRQIDGSKLSALFRLLSALRMRSRLSPCTGNQITILHWQS